ncbi:MAG: glycosyltransferase involved in cell wall biosynthesis [Colwellia sp.]|jgi:glycosyltransferase involved in cell wall biosynthesis|uniref:Glycosyltransferase n=1 Tax=Colwellia sp. C1 TaxID=1737566 RepID=A0A0P0KX61_9GAMM|nr:Glycosyltransferase [Colwellia sp. C1]
MIFFIGPKLKPITGQAMAFNMAFTHYLGGKRVFYYEGSNGGVLTVIFKNLFLFFLFLYHFIFNFRDVKCVYLTTSRSLTGFIRDALFILTCRLFKVRIVNHLHGADFINFRDSLKWPFKSIVDFVYSKIDTSIVLMLKMKEQYAMYDGMKVVSISNCAPPMSNLPKKHSDSLKILYLSNIMYSKGVLFVIEAVDNLIKLGIDVQLTIAGSPMGDEYKTSEEIQLIFKEMITGKDYIDYLGTVTGIIKEQLLADSDVFVLPSFYRTEAQPISILEAMLSGSAIITTNHNYLSDLINSNNGFVVEPRSAKGIETSILELINDKSKLESISVYNKDYAEKHYSLETYVNQISKVINN